MSEEKKYNYTAADIERYHKGQMTAKEMHELEKAALDDPFLADALEGYGLATTGTPEDIAELHDRLNERTGKVVSIKRKRFFILRAAAAILVIAGSALLVYRFAFNKENSPSVAKLEQKNITPLTDSVVGRQTVNGTDSLNGTANVLIRTDKLVESKESGNVSEQKDDDIKTEFLSTNSDSVKMSFNIVRNQPSQVPAGLANGENKIAKQPDEKAKQESAMDKLAKENVAKPKSSNGNDWARGYTSNERADSVEFNTKNAGAYRKFATNYFHGQVIDVNKNPLPFANVTSTRENVGTYTDARGNFTLVSSDSILNVQVRSVGFENNQALLKNSISNNQVVLQEENRIADTVLTYKRFNEKRSRDANMKFEEPEPADGWTNYDTYLVNNVMVPKDALKKNKTGVVELSFEVDENGEPVNIKVEKSLCSDCDKEAIRLIKQGPRWKSKGARSRVTVSVPFNL